MGGLSRLSERGAAQIGAVLIAQRGHLLCWVPVCLAVGIGTYFSVKSEPETSDFVTLALVAGALILSARALPESLSFLPVALALCLAGFGIAGVRAHAVAAPTLDWRYYGPVEGRVVAMDRSQSDALRLTLDRVRLERVPPDRTPERVRISLHGEGTTGITPEPGLRVMTTAHLSPPSGPVEPGGFDFQRHAWFARLGAVGYTRVPLVGVASPEAGQAGLLVFRIRMAASAHIRATLPGDTGGFAAAVTTGDRSAISRDALEALRASNLTHLLAISGLHMGLLTAVVIAALRLIFAAHPHTALHWPTKGIAATGALIAACGYLALSGGNVATQRAFIMVAVALAALIIGRRAISLRAVAVAATLVLILRPEALMGPGFQMSFAATTALVAVFGWLRGVEHGLLPRWSRPAFGVFISSLVAGLATAPIAAAHFNAIAHYGLIANLLSVPLMGVLVIPAAVLALVLAPLGLEWIGLWLMGLGLDWILGVAHWVAAIDGARGHVVGPGPWVLPLLSLGFLLLILWQGRLRWVGLAAMAASFALWQTAERPDVLISDTGTLVGVMTAEGRALSKAKGASFVARNWLENDGSGVSQSAAAKLWQPGPLVHLSGKRAVAGFKGCARAQTVVASVEAAHLQNSCTLFDPPRLRHTGAVALYRQGEGWRMRTARDAAGDRLWTAWPDQPPEGDQYVRINPTSRP
ncbi:ComEC/Rec2 family competence protein [Marimonas sp. MJW-29]|uniref:ComEC/Rec2 family competence protein n=1 Tax=Sulfitobacter sediminis TaxID=3234186 RepID=A0ABV3RNX8_9RHOB